VCELKGLHANGKIIDFRCLRWGTLLKLCTGANSGENKKLIPAALTMNGPEVTYIKPIAGIQDSIYKFTMHEIDCNADLCE
jgi:hypothetical protein